MFPWCHSVSVPVIQYTHKKVTSVKSSTWTFSLRPDQPVLQPPDLITSSWCDKPVVLLQNPLPSLQLKLHSHERWCLILLLLSTFPSFPFPNCCSQVSQSALAPSLTALHHSAVPCISHRAIVPWLFFLRMFWSLTPQRRFLSSLGAPSPVLHSLSVPKQAGEALPAGNSDAWAVLSSRINHQSNWWFYPFQINFFHLHMLYCPPSLADNQWIIVALHQIFNHSNR